MEAFDAGEQGEDRVARAGAAKLGGEAAVAKRAARAGQRLEMVGARIGRRQDEEDEVDRKSVDRLEVDRRRQPREEADDPVEPLELGVGNRSAGAEAGRAGLLAFREG